MRTHRYAPGTEPGYTSGTGNAEEEKSGRLTAEGLQTRTELQFARTQAATKTAEHDRLPKEAPRQGTGWLYRGLSFRGPRSRMT